MSRRGENIYKRKDGRWEGRYIRGRNCSGKAIYGYVYAKSYREIKQKLSAHKQEENCKKSALPYDGKSRNICHTVSEVAQDWLQKKKPQIKISSYSKYNNLLRDYVNPFLGDYDIESLSAIDIEHFCEKLLISGGKKESGLSAKTVNDTLSIVRSILRYAARQNYNTVCSGKEIAIKSGGHRTRVLSDTEQDTLIRYLKKDLCHKNIGILLCLTTGIRLGELCALQWDDISFSEKAIHVHHTMQRIQTDEPTGAKTKIMVATPKSECSIRWIPLPDEIVSILSCVAGSHTGYLLTGEKEQFVEPRAMESHFKKVLSNCKIDNTNFHTLRHTFATRCIELGFDVKTLSEILGHANTSITMNRYVHPSMALKRESMQKLSTLLSVR